MHRPIRNPAVHRAFALLLFALLALPGTGRAASAQEAATAPSLVRGPRLDPIGEVDPELRAALIKAVSETDGFSDRFDAEVWLMDMSRRLERRVPDPKFRLELLRNVHYEATRAGLSPEVVLAVIDIESGFNPYAISVAGARGLMQVMPFWLKEIGKPGDSLFRMRTNLRYGCTILKYYLGKEGGNLNLALRRYNGTTEPTYSVKVDKLLRSRWYRQ